MKKDVALFDDPAYLSTSPAAQADRLVEAWRATPQNRPIIWTDRKRQVFARRVRQAIEAGFDPEVIITALGVVYLGREVISQSAWDTALDVATRKNAAANDYRLTDTQRSILKPRGPTGNISG
jgi:hypothetical protein